MLQGKGKLMGEEAFPSSAQLRLSSWGMIALCDLGGAPDRPRQPEWQLHFSASFSPSHPGANLHPSGRGTMCTSGQRGGARDAASRSRASQELEALMALVWALT